jgi:hypothetical protein
MADSIGDLISARSQLRSAQHWLAMARRDGRDIQYHEDVVKHRLDRLWDAQIAAAAYLIICIGVDHALRLGLGWSIDE